MEIKEDSTWFRLGSGPSRELWNGWRRLRSTLHNPKSCYESCSTVKTVEPSLESSQVASPHFWSERLPCSSKMCSSPPPPDRASGRRRRSRVREASRARRFPPACIRRSCCSLTCHSSSRFLQERMLVIYCSVDLASATCQQKNRFRDRFSGSKCRQVTGQRFYWPNFRQKSRTGFFKTETGFKTGPKTVFFNRTGCPVLF